MDKDIKRISAPIVLIGYLLGDEPAVKADFFIMVGDEPHEVTREYLVTRTLLDLVAMATSVYYRLRDVNVPLLHDKELESQLSKTLIDMGFSSRAMTVFRKLKLVTMLDLHKVGMAKLRNYSGCGESTIRDIRQTIRDNFPKLASQLCP